MTCGHRWNALPWVVVEAESIVIFKRVLDLHVDMQGIGGDMVYVQAEAISLTWYPVQHRHCGPKSLLVCCIICSMFFLYLYAHVILNEREM